MSCLNVTQLQEVAADDAAPSRPSGISLGFSNRSRVLSKIQFKNKHYNKLPLMNTQ